MGEGSGTKLKLITPIEAGKSQSEKAVHVVKNMEISTARYVNNAVQEYTGIDPTRKDEGLQKQSPVAPQLSNDTSLRQVVSGSSGVIKEVYDKKDNKR